MVMKTTAQAAALTVAMGTLCAAAAQAGLPEQTITRAGSQATTSGPEAFFTGRVRVGPVFGPTPDADWSAGYVTFEPGARSAWHTHPAGQRLIVTAGLGRTAVWGGPVVDIRAGDTLWCPPGVKHWHGAAPGSSMTHLALTLQKDGRNVQWLEKVTDAQYGR